MITCLHSRLLISDQETHTRLHPHWVT